MWDQHYWNREGADEPEVLGKPARGDRVPAGRYVIEVTGLLDAPVSSEPFVIQFTS